KEPQDNAQKTRELMKTLRGKTPNAKEIKELLHALRQSTHDESARSDFKGLTNLALAGFMHLGVVDAVHGYVDSFGELLEESLLAGQDPWYSEQAVYAQEFYAASAAYPAMVEWGSD